MEDDWGDWAAPAPFAAAAAQQQAPQLQSASAGRQVLDPSLFSAEQESEFGGFAAAPAPLPAQADQQHPARQQGQQQRERQPLAKGDPAWLLDGRTNAWLEGTVVSIDRTIHPPSYGVELADGRYRETEEHRLLPRRPGEAPPPPAASANEHHAPSAWAAAAASPFNQPAGGVGKTATAAAVGLLPVEAPVPGTAAAPAAAAAAAAADEEDDFGDWAAASASPAPAAAIFQAPVAQAVPGSPRVGAATHAAQSSAHGSPQRLSSRRSSAASSPVLDRFRSFLHAAAPQVSEQLELEEAAEEQAAAAGQQRREAYGSLQQFAATHLPPSPRGGAPAVPAVPLAAPVAAAAMPVAAGLMPTANGWGDDDFGNFEAAEPAPPPHQQQQPPAAAPPHQAVQQLQRQAPHQQQLAPQPAKAVALKGVQRNAPLPLDLFGGELVDDVAANGIEPAAQPAAAVARTADAPAPAAPVVAALGAPAAAAVGAAGSTAADGSEWDDEFTDFVSSPPAAAAEAAASAVQHPVAAAAVEQAPAVAQPAAAAQQAAGVMQVEQHAAGQPPAGAVQGPAAIEAGSQPVSAGGSLSSPPEASAVAAAAAAASWPDASEASPAGGAGSAEQPSSFQLDGLSAAALAPPPPPPLPVPQQQPVSPSSAGSAGSRQSALLAALHPVSSGGSSARSSFEQPRAAGAPAAPHQQWGAVPPAAPLAAAAMLAAGPAAGVTAAGPAAVAGAAAAGAAWSGVGEELVEEYAVAWVRLLEATAAQLQASAALWAEAGSHGCLHELQQLPAARQHLAACTQLYHAAAIVRLAAQQLGLFSLVGELQEAWAQVEAAWLSPAPAPASDDSDSGSSSGSEPVGQQQQQQQAQQPAFRDAALAAWEAASAESGGGPAAVQGLLQSAGAQLEAMNPDDFPRMLAWSEGLCGLTLLPLSLFEGVLPVAPWDELAGRPCLVPLANLWLHRVSGRAPQLD